MILYENSSIPSLPSALSAVVIALYSWNRLLSVEIKKASPTTPRDPLGVCNSSARSREAHLAVPRLMARMR